MQKRLGCLAPQGLVAAGLTVVAIALVLLFWGGSLFSPGPLNAQAGAEPLGGVRSHAEVGGRCSACHPAPWGAETMSDHCLACHVEVQGQLADPASLHGTLDAAGGVRPCFLCHGEHGGADAPLTRLTGNGFPHQATGFSLEGHAQTAGGDDFVCADCHDQDLTEFDPATCAECHGEMDAVFLQAHRGAFGDGCLACHDGVDRYGAAFDHDQLAFPLEGAHDTAGCAGCHPNARTPSDLRSAPQDCYACHREDDAHGGDLGQDCAACHMTRAWEEATFDHDTSAFPLEGAHSEVECGDCHQDAAFGGTPTDCYACHQEDDAHAGELGQDCAACHTPQAWEEAMFDHDATAFPLEGEHREVDCGDCHQDAAFGGTPTDCYACHREDDAHGGELGQDCAECHTPQDWSEVTFDHAQTAFPLDGAHLDVVCGDCHQDAVFAGTPAECAACHDEPAYHAGLFDRDCAGCHDTAAWSPAEFDRVHQFPFNHGEAGISPCATCHPDRLADYTCYECHEHRPAEIAAEHREEGITDFQDCVRCHPTGREEEGEDGDD